MAAGISDILEKNVVDEWLRNIAENYREIDGYGYGDVLDDLVEMLVEEGLVSPGQRSLAWRLIDKYLHRVTGYGSPGVLKWAVEQAITDFYEMLQPYFFLLGVAALG